MGAQLLNQLGGLASPGSSAEIVFDPRVYDPDELAIPPIGTLDVTLTPHRAVTRPLAEAARGSQLTAILLLAYRRSIGPDEADSRTLLNLTALRRELAADEERNVRVVVELADSQNVELARMTGADDYIISDAITSRLIAQLAEQPERRPVLQCLYATDGPSIQLVRAAELHLTGEVGFDEVIATAYASGLLAIGWRRDAGAELVLNPSDSTTVRLDEGDQLVVIG